MIEEGATNLELVETKPTSYARNMHFFHHYRQLLIEEKYSTTRRENLKVTYICGSPGVGKTRYIMDKYGDGNVYRITDYDKNMAFDNYNNEDIVVFEEFRSQVRIDIMLSWLDIYPLKLKARYQNKQACYTKVYITTNWKLSEQYKKVQESHPLTWQAFLRRIHEYYNFDQSKTEQVPKHTSLYDLIPVSEDELPF